ncbi:MAG TPA: FtsX-like permease family protein [Nevskia sp.]|nr:FtsX-like permease family protein [Nevskia sp.]
MTAHAFRHALIRLRRGWRSGELLVLSLALLVASAAIVSVGMFSGRIQDAVQRGSGEAFGADARIDSHDPYPAEFLARLRATGARSLLMTRFVSVLAPERGEQTQLATVKAVEAGYPLRGSLTLSREPYAALYPANGIPAPGEVWVDGKLWSALGLSPGARIQVGNSLLKVAALVANEPGRGGAFAEFAPELLMNAQDLAATGLVGPGSRVEYILQLGGEPPALAAVQKLALPAGARYRSLDDSRPEIRSTITRAGHFLGVAVLATILLAAAAVALTARQYSQRLRDEVALLKCLGARRAFIHRALALQLVLLGLAAGGIGAALGALGQAVLGWFAAPLLDTTLPPPSWWPLPEALGLCLLMLAGFALPPVLDAAAAPPVRVFQRAAGGELRSRLGLVAGLLAVAVLVGVQSGEPQLAGWVILGAGATAGVLALLAWGLVRLLSPLRRRSGVAWRFGLGNIARRRGSAVAQAVALGIALLALLLITVVRTDLLSSWRDRLPPDAPNQFLVNIQPEQVPALRRFFAERGFPPLDMAPMVRGRLVALNGKPVTADSFQDQETRRWINREFNLSWTDHFGADNKLVDGRWWSAADAGKPWLSVDEYGVERLGLMPGTTMTLEIAGVRSTFTVHNTRKVRWDSFRPNFFIVTPPGVLENSGAVQWITSFYLPPQQRPLLRELVRQFPNVTALDLDAMLGQVRGIVDRIVAALEFIFAFTLGAGLVVMLAVIEASRAQRARETALLRTLGASSRVILQGLLAEYAVLGLLAGGVAAIAAQAMAWVLAAQVFDIPYGPRPLLWLAGAASGCALVTLVGWISLRGVLRTPPRQVLAAG